MNCISTLLICIAFLHGFDCFSLRRSTPLPEKTHQEHDCSVFNIKRRDDVDDDCSIYIRNHMEVIHVDFVTLSTEEDSSLDSVIAIDDTSDIQDNNDADDCSVFNLKTNDFYDDDCLFDNTMKVTRVQFNTALVVESESKSESNTILNKHTEEEQEVEQETGCSVFNIKENDYYDDDCSFVKMKVTNVPFNVVANGGGESIKGAMEDDATLSSATTATATATAATTEVKDPQLYDQHQDCSTFNIKRDSYYNDDCSFVEMKTTHVEFNVIDRKEFIESNIQLRVNVNDRDENYDDNDDDDDDFSIINLKDEDNNDDDCSFVKKKIKKVTFMTAVTE
jgi:hypothetical protein